MNAVKIAPVSVVIPTVGRPTLLRQCLQSLTECAPTPAEVVIVDQSGTRAIAELEALFAHINVRYVRSGGHGRGLAVNEGLAAATQHIVMVTDDDCTVARDWVGEGGRLMGAHPGAIITGRVLPTGDPAAVPSTRDGARAVDYTGSVEYGVLYAGNMVCDRAALLAFDAFDAGIVPSAEDNDLCYRWLRAGRALRFEPTLVVWHHDWRSSGELKRLYQRYAEGQGRFYAKHLRNGDVMMLRFLARDLYRAASSLAARKERRPWRDPWQETTRGLLRGLAGGLAAAPARPGADTMARVDDARGGRARRALRLARRRIRKRARRVWPPVGFVRLGSLRRLTPISGQWGADRGQPIDRYYIERFLARYSGDGEYIGGEIRGDVMEIGEDAYARRFGGYGRPGGAVTSVAILHGDDSNPNATIVGDLASGDGIRSDAYDCVICTQTLLLIYDVRAAIKTLHRCLKPGGVALVTIPGISQICSPDIDLWGDHWRFTTRSARRLFEEDFPPQEVRVEAAGNVLASVAFLHGLAVEDLRQAELDVNDPNYQLVITVRARKAGGGA